MDKKFIIGEESKSSFLAKLKADVKVSVKSTLIIIVN